MNFRRNLGLTYVEGEGGGGRGREGEGDGRGGGGEMICLWQRHI